MPNHTLFISDLHLQQSQTHITELFLTFLKTQARQADALYILGDFFEAWIGDDDRSEFNNLIASALHTLTSGDTPVYLMRGNRDFLLGETFARASGCQLLPDPSTIKLYGRTLVLTHGDSLCSMDTTHLRFRQLTQNPRYNRYFLRLPLTWRQAIARLLRHWSQKRTRKLPYAQMDVSQEAVVDILNSNQSTLLIHGHTHNPGTHHFQLHHLDATRIVLGAWHDQGSVLVFSDDGHYELRSF